MGKMSRLARAGIVAVALCLFLPSGSSAVEKKVPIKKAGENERGGFSLSLRLGGGFAMFSGGDLSEGAKGYYSYFNISASMNGWLPSGEFSELKSGIEAGADVVLHFGSNFGVGIGGGYLWGQRENPIVFTKGSESATATITTKMSAVPLRVGLYYFMPLGSKLELVFNAGAGYYLTQADFNIRQEEGGDWYDELQNGKSDGIGFHGSVGIEYSISSSLVLFLDVRGRLLTLDNYVGTWSEVDSSGYSDSGSGKFWFFKVETPAGDFPMIRLSPEGSSPVPVDVSDLRAAKIDFSGICLTAGVRIRL